MGLQAFLSHAFPIKIWGIQLTAIPIVLYMTIGSLLGTDPLQSLSDSTPKGAPTSVCGCHREVPLTYRGEKSPW